MLKNKYKIPKFDEADIECIVVHFMYYWLHRKITRRRRISRPEHVVDRNNNHTRHDFVCENVKILYRETNSKKRLLIKMIHITQHKNTNYL